MTHRTVFRSAFAAVMLLLSATAHAQLFRAYLAPSGNDMNACTLPAPCRLLPAALATVADGGEIWMLDSANYNTGPVNITKSVTILAVPGALGSVLATGGNAINIATAGVKVALRNLVIVPFPGMGGTGGISMTAGAGLTVENCLIANLPQYGIYVDTAASVQITDTTIRDNGSASFPSFSSFGGLSLKNGARATVKRATISGNVGGGVSVSGTGFNTTTSADIADSTVAGNGANAGGYGVAASSDSASSVVIVSIHNSRIVQNKYDGVSASSSDGGTVTLSVSNNMISNNGTGITAASGAIFASICKVWASGNTVSDNSTGFLTFFDASIESAGNNAVRNNGTDTAGTITVIPTK